MKGKINSIYAAMIVASMPFSSFANDASYTVIVDKSANYTVKPINHLPSEETGVQATVANLTTNETDTGDILLHNIAVDAENGDEITVITDVVDDSGTVEGVWSSNIALTFDDESIDGVDFTVPEMYDGDIELTLTLSDENYQDVLETILVQTEYWTATDPIVSDWNVVVVEDWSPDLSAHYENELVSQTRVVDKDREVQAQEERPETGEVRTLPAETETETGVVESRDEYGLMEYWEETDPLVITDWTVVEIFQDWNPDASTVYETETVDQSREVKKERVIQEQEVRPATGDIRVVSGNITDTAVEFEYRTVNGELEYWENTGTSTCTEWVHDRTEDWMPDASDYDRSQEVEQTRLVYERRECSGNQYRPATGETRQATAEVEYQSETETRTVYGTKIDLNDWSTSDTNGSWSVSQDGSYAYQAINGNPTIFASNVDTYGNTTIKGKIRVRDGAGDDDYIGMVFGMQNTNDFYMWSWKRSNQTINSGMAYEGHFLSHVTGGVDSINWFMEQDKTGYDALDSLISTSVGWNHGTYYDFEILYSSTKIEVRVNGTKVVEASGSNFPAGKIGFFNLSQGEVEYYKVTDEPLSK